MKSDLLFILLCLSALCCGVFGIWALVEFIQLIFRADGFNWWVVLSWVVSAMACLGLAWLQTKHAEPVQPHSLKRSVYLNSLHTEKLVKVGSPLPFKTKNKGVDLRDIKCCSTKSNSIESGISFDTNGESGKAILRFHFLEDNGVGLFQTEKHMHLNAENAKELIMQILSLFPALGNLLQWTLYDFDKKTSHPPHPGRYLIYRPRCKKMHFERFNGNGWASTNHEELLWSDPTSPLTTLK